MFDIITVGSAVVDVFVDTDIAEKGKFIAYPVGSKILIKNLKFDIGGGGTNTAVAFSRLGLKTGYIGKIGNDTDGEEIMSVLKKEKVKFLGKIQKGTISGYSIILDSKEHDRTILTYKGTNDNLKANEMRIPKTKWLYFSSMLGESFKTQIKLAKFLTRRGTKLAFNPSSYQTEKGSKYLKPLLKLTNILILNKEEAQMLTKHKDLLKGLHSLGPKIVCITNKNKPVYCYDGNKKYSITPNKKVKVVERTGAGDAFASGLVAGIIKKNNINLALKLGLENSESVIQHFGAKNKLLYWSEVK